MKFKDNEIFLYKERDFPRSRDPRKNPLERSVYVWKYASTSNKIRKDSSIVLGRLKDKSRLMLVKNILDTNCFNKNSNIILLSNSDYRASFSTEGSHGHEWIHQEKGLSRKTLELFAKNFSDRGFNVFLKECSTSIRYLF